MTPTINPSLRVLLNRGESNQLPINTPSAIIVAVVIIYLLSIFFRIFGKTTSVAFRTRTRHLVVWVMSTTRASQSFDFTAQGNYEPVIGIVASFDTIPPTR